MGESACVVSGIYVVEGPIRRPEVRAKISASMTGRKLSSSTRAKISVARKAYWVRYHEQQRKG